MQQKRSRKAKHTTKGKQDAPQHTHVPIVTKATADLAAYEKSACAT